MKNIQEMTVEELKAMAYDQLAIIERAQQNLRVLNEEIAKKLKENGQDKESDRPKGSK